MKKVLAEIKALEGKLAIDWKKEREKFEESKKPQTSKKDKEPDLSQYDPKIRPGIEKMQEQVKKHDERNPFSQHYNKPTTTILRGPHDTGGKIHTKTESRMVEKELDQSAGKGWFERLPEEEKADYLRRHPQSKYA